MHTRSSIFSYWIWGFPYCKVLLVTPFPLWCEVDFLWSVRIVQELLDLAKAAEYFQLKSVVRWLDSIIRLPLFSLSRKQYSLNHEEPIMWIFTNQRERFPFSNVLKIPWSLSHGACGASWGVDRQSKYVCFHSKVELQWSKYFIFF